MEWVETTARTVEEAKELALDQLGVGPDDADFEVLSEPKQGLFGRLRGEARVRARVRPAPVRPKQDRRRGRRSTPGDGGGERDTGDAEREPEAQGAEPSGNRRNRPRTATEAAEPVTQPDGPEGGTVMTSDDREDADHDGEGPDVEAVRQAAVAFVGGLSDAFGFETSVEASVEGSEIEVRVDGPSLGLLIGPGGRTLLAIQDLARVAAQRRLGDHDTRLRVDVAGYREKRREALERFAVTVADQVKETGVARSLDPMPSADRKVLHDVLSAIDGVNSRSEGEDPNRRVVVSPS
jgi:spoIIIJ-associated protein